MAGYAARRRRSGLGRNPSAILTPICLATWVQMDCFYGGRLSGTKGVTWQYTAIDVASAHVWAELYVSPKNPDPRW